MRAAPLSGPEISDPAVAVFYDRLPAELSAPFERLRRLIGDVAANNPSVGPLAESLKWGEPSYAPMKKGVGSSVRLARHRDGVAVHFICHTGLVEKFRELYPDVFDYEGNRTIVVKPGAELDEAALAHCVGMALTYHMAKNHR